MAGTLRQGTRRSRWMRWADALAAFRAGLARPAPAFAAEPEPRRIGSVGRGRQLVAGSLLFAGHLIEAPGAMLWDIPAPNAAWTEETHGFDWLDDLAAVPDPRARALAQAWVQAWIRRYGRGRGPGWTAPLAARRLMRLISHAEMLLTGADAAAAAAFRRALGRQALFLARRWPAVPPGLRRFESLCGMIVAGLSLTGMADRVAPAVQALARDCAERIDAKGGLPTRNPEELLEVLALLTAAVDALTGSGRPVPGEILAAIERAAPTLRALRHADGGLARFHGGGRGAEGRLDAALAASGVRTPPGHGPAMGFVRLAAGRTTVIVDAAPPPPPPFAAEAHASTLAFELTSGRRPLIVSCGSGASFGADWRRAGRATPSHSALCIEGYSSARLAPSGRLGGPDEELLIDGPRDVRCERSEGDGEHRLVLSHDGWVATHGLTCFRELVLTTDGRALSGEETLAALAPEDRAAFDRARTALRSTGVPFSVRFHLHPDVDAQLDLGGTAVSLALRSGEVWVFRHDGIADLSLEPSVYLERGRLAPRATRQIVLSSMVRDEGARVGWTLAKALDTPSHVRDFEMPDLAPLLDSLEETPR